jgi:hypothetical protein
MTERDPTPSSTVDDDGSWSRKAIVGVTGTLVLAFGWFYISFAIQGSPFIDAVGETLGALAAGLLLVSVFGAVRSNH